LALMMLWAGHPFADEAKERARQHFQKGQTEYDLGNFEGAVAEWEKAYRLFSSPALLFNLGQAHRQLGNTERALFFYRGYLRNDPEALNRAEVERWIAELEAAQEPEPASAPPPEPAEPAVTATAEPPLPSLGRPGLRRAGYWTLGASAAVLAGGVVFGILAKSKSDELEDAGAAGDVVYDRTDGLRSNGENYEKAQIISLIVGGAGAVAGGVLVWLGWPRGPAEVAVGPSGFMIQGSF